MGEIVVRPVPSEAEVAAIKEGKDKASIGVSSAWYEKGALVAADGAMWVVDADGRRRDVPCPPNGRLLRTYSWSPRGNDSHFYNLTVTDEQMNRFADLPVFGLEKVAGLDVLAQAAGLTFADNKVNVLTERAPDQHKGPGYQSLEKACLASGDRSALGRLFHRS